MADALAHEMLALRADGKPRMRVLLVPTATHFQPLESRTLRQVAVLTTNKCREAGSYSDISFARRPRL
jgi:hypothetical protein